MDKMEAYIDINEDCTSGIPKLNMKDLEHSEVAKLEGVGKILTVLKFDEFDLGGSTLNDFREELQDNMDTIVYINGSETLAVGDFDILYSKNDGFVHLPWTNNRIKEKCDKIKEIVAGEGMKAYKFEENGLKAYDLDKVKYIETGDSFENDSLDKARLCAFAQKFTTKPAKCVLSSYCDDDYDIYLTMPNRNYLDTINIFQESYKESLKKPIYIKDELSDYEIDKDFFTIEDTKDDNTFVHFSIPAMNFFAVVGGLIENIDNENFKVAEDILEGLSVYQDKYVAIFETNSKIGISEELILDIVKEREDIPKAVLVYNMDNAEEDKLVEAMVAMKGWNGDYTVFHREVADRDDLNDHYIKYAKELKRIDEEARAMDEKFKDMDEKLKTGHIEKEDEFKGVEKDIPIKSPGDDFDLDF